MCRCGLGPCHGLLPRQLLQQLHGVLNAGEAHKHPHEPPLLASATQDKRAADEQEKAVNAEATKIGREAEEANAIAQQVGVQCAGCREGLIGPSMAGC